MNTPVRARHAARGFSMVELLVTIFMAGIIFAAMVPVFYGALKKSASDNNRVTATNLAQQRIERARQLAYKDITTSNLNSATYPNNLKWFVPSATVGGKPYTFLTDVFYAAAPADSPPGTLAPYKSVKVTVTWYETYDSVTSPHTTTVATVVKNPDATTMTASPIPGPFDVTVSFKNWDDVSPTGKGYGVSIIRQVPTPVITLSPSLLQPTGPAPNNTVSWSDVDGGYGITYVVQCIGKHGTKTTPFFRLLSDAWLKFDTDPGQPGHN
jgi:prepilin-type N-terminal cleavage/methylation domain-containing protein